MTKVEHKTGRWSDRHANIEVVSPYTDQLPKPREPRTTGHLAGPGPYESSYDISRGYGHDRSIHLP